MGGARLLRRRLGAHPVAVAAITVSVLASLVVVTIVGASGADAEAGVIGGVAVAVLLRLTGRHELLCVLAGLLVTAAVRALA